MQMSRYTRIAKHTVRMKNTFARAKYDDVQASGGFRNFAKFDVGSTPNL